MNQENITTLYDRHPNVCSTQPAFECNDGWFDLIDTALYLIEAHLKPRSEIGFSLWGIKEKFGTMSITYQGGDEYIRGITNHAMAMSHNLCEYTGTPGELHISENCQLVTCCDTVAERLNLTKCAIGNK